ncbi:MAG: VWA domain-containing protein [Pontimonas sp.]|nr:VWA domain-containing protein [Pontimonas sp.]
MKILTKPIIGALMLALVAVGFAPSAAPAQAIEISAVGERAFEDVTTCLTSGRDKALNVHYLMDQSGSLSWTDSDLARVEILQNSVAELGSFVEQGVSVQVAATGFANGVQTLQDWTPIGNRSDAAAMGMALSNAIQLSSESFSTKTDWEQGLRAAQQSFGSAPEGCSMLIWFTDGGINPSLDADIDSLSDLCQAGIGYESLPSGAGALGLMQEFRQSGIPIFGVLLNNEQSSLEHYRQTEPATADDRLAYEKWLMSFLRPLVEGIGQVEATSAYGQGLTGGELQCGELDASGFAPPGQANGAFIDAADPVALAFQFLRIGGQTSGGKGVPIVDGSFVVPQGTTGFQVIVSSDDWQLIGPEGSEFSASDASPGSASVDMSGGATKIDVRVGTDDLLVGEWLLDTSAQYAELFIFTGLTLELDRDRVSTILSDFDNTLTGRVVRTQQFSDLSVDLSRYPSANFSVSVLEDGVLVDRDVSIESTTEGQFKIERFNPGSQSGELQLWLTLSLGSEFQDITSQFALEIVDKTALATPSADLVTLSVLEGPEGVATGSLVITGPNVSDSSTFCLSAAPLRLDDAQSKADQPVERAPQFSWSFSGLSADGTSNCVVVGRDEVVTVDIQATNPLQANASVVSTWQVTSTAEGIAARFDAPITIEFESTTQSNTAVEITAIILLLLLGLLLPLALMWLINWAGTRFLPMDSVMRASFPVTVDSSGPFSKLLLAGPGAETGPLIVAPDDFKNLMDQNALRDYDTGAGRAVAKIPLFPLAATWYQWNAPEGHRIIGFYDGGTKHSTEIDAGHALEVSPNMAENWALVVPDSELRKDAAEKISGQLVVFSRMSNLGDYEKRVGEISVKPGFGDRVTVVRAAVESTVVAKDGNGDDSSHGPTTGSFSAPDLPSGFSASGSSAVPPSSPLQPPRPPQSGPLAPPPPPQ